jgi:signal transduction histidine kinase
MADRLASLGGSFDIQSTPGEGTTVHGAVPIDTESPLVASPR